MSDQGKTQHLPNSLPGNYLSMQTESNKNPLRILSTTNERLSFIHRCERYHKKSTQEHINHMKIEILRAALKIERGIKQPLIYIEMVIYQN